MDDIASEDDVRERFPRTSSVLELMGEVLHEAVDEVEAVLSGLDVGKTDDDVDRMLEDGLKRVLESLDPKEEDAE